jgi:hypothetical protein
MEPMYAVVLAGQILVLLVMVTVSYWGWRNIDPETRIRARDISEDSTMRSKTTTLMWSPIIGLVVVLGTFAVGDSSSRDTAAVLGLGVVLIFLFAHWATVKRAAR